MLIGREKELEYLKEWEKKTGIRILVLYGQKGIGKTTLLKKFLEGKNGFYYEAVSCSSRQQKAFLASYLNNMEVCVPENCGYEKIFAVMEEKGKRIWIIDEFHHIYKNDVEFFESFSSYFITGERGKDLFLILSTSSSGWAENLREERLMNYFLLQENRKQKATGISEECGIFYERNSDKIQNDETEKNRKNVYDNFCCEKVKLKELKYQDFREKFPLFSLEDSVGVFSILGGNPGLWKKFNDKYTLRENIENFILQKEEKLFEYGQQYIEEELREPAVYNTILTVLADGKCKLNEIYQTTGFSRAKISVYLKNLIQLEVVEKVISVDTEGRENAQKGVYKICNSYLRFYYKYIFTNQNVIGIWEKEKIFETLIEPTLMEFIEQGFKQVCQEFLERENALGRLPEKFSYLGEWVGKKGKIDFIYINKKKEILAGICNWKKGMMQYEDYERFMECQENAKIKAEYMILFSAGNFDNRLRQEAKRNPYLALVSADRI